MQKQVCHLTLADSLLVMGRICPILALNKHGLHDEQVTVTIWTGPLTFAREHIYTLTELVEIAEESEAADG